MITNRYALIFSVFFVSILPIQAMNVVPPQGQAPLSEAQKALLLFRTRGLLLVKAAQGNRTAVVNAFLPTIGIQVNTQDQIGKTALHYAVANQNTQMVQSLLDAQANPVVTDNAGQTPLDLAQQLGNEDIIALLSPEHE